MHLNRLRGSSASHRLSLAGGIVAGTTLVVAGLTLAYATFATPLVSAIAGGDRLATGPGLGGVLTWSLTVIGVVAFLAIGGWRLADVLARSRGARFRVDPLAAGLPDDVALVRGVDVGDGRPIPSLLVGRFGAAVVRELPDAAVTRRQGPYWEAKTADGWIRIENPLERAARDAERVRRWFSQDDRDFVIRVYAAVIATDASLPRTPGCAVIGPRQVPAWVASLPVQRSLTDDRRSQLVRMVRGS